MIKERDLVIILVCLSILMAVAWFWLYLQPTMDRIEALERRTLEREQALDLRYSQVRQRRVTYDRLTEEYQRIRAEWDIAAAALPRRFYDTEVLEHIQRVIYPHTDSLSLSFSDSVQRPGDQLWSTTISLSFNTTYWQFLSILDDLVYGELGNRVINYSLGVSPLSHSDFFYMVQGPAVEFLSDDMRAELTAYVQHVNAYFGGPNAPIGDVMIGPYTLSISMSIEYLGLEAGRMPVEAWRRVWESERAAALMAE